MSIDREPVSDELVALSVLREQRWVYERRMERMTWHEIERIVATSPEAGGLGYPLTIATMRAAHRKYVREMIEVEDRTREEHGHMALLDLDRMQRATESALAEAIERSRASGDGVPFGEVIETVKVGLKVNESRRRLLGLDAPSKVEASVTVERDLEAEVAKLLGVTVDGEPGADEVAA